jgi:dolichol-phosphate mannosyltransferase
MLSKPKVSIVIPAYNEAANLTPLLSRLRAVTERLERYSWDFIIVNDGSPDDSWDVMQGLAKTSNDIKIIDLSRNFGKEIALTAGVSEAEDFESIICIDADLQHPPEIIPLLIEEWENGAEIVATIRTGTKNKSLLRTISSKMYYWLMGKISGLNMVSQTTDFRLYDKKVILAFCRATERERMFRGIMDWMGFRRSYVYFQADERTEGEVNYSFFKLWKLAITSITSFSLLPLKFAGYIGLLITCTSGLLFAWMTLNYFITNKWVYTPLAIVVVANTFLIGIVLISIGLVALYIGTIHTEVINRPLYVVREKINFRNN